MLESSSRSSVETSEEAGPRLELTTAEVRQVWALYSTPAHEETSALRCEGRVAPRSSLLEGLLPLAWRARRQLAQSAAAALALGVLFLILATPTFRVDALVLVEPHGAAWRAGAGDVATAGFLDAQAAIVAGAPVVRDALVRAGLDASAGPGGWRERLGGWLPAAPQTSDEALGAAVTRALRSLSATPVHGTEVISLEYRTQDPAGGKRFLRAVIDRYAELARSLGPQAAGMTVRTLAEPTQQATPLWPRPLPVLFASLVVGLLVGLAFAVRAERTETPATEWTEIREAAWAA